MVTSSLPRVVLVHVSGVGMRAARTCATSIAGALGAELWFARIARPRPRFWSAFLPGSWLEGHRALREALDELKVLARWSSAHKRKKRPPPSALPVAGDAHLLEICRDPRVELVVVPSTLSSRAARLARRSGVAVLLAQSAPVGQSPLLAATNLLHPTRPVLRRAADFARRLQSPLNVVHNLPGFAAQLVAAGLGATVMALPDDRAVAATVESQLKIEVATLGYPAEVAVTRRLDTVTGILEAASRSNADTIVLGARAPHLFHNRVCERVCTMTDRNVLLVPA
ncbi:MAG: universal stress protein [Archangium sp.]|nr:universal stress protein [Archangium sp.]